MTVAKFEPAFTRCWNNLRMIGNLTVKNSLQDFDAKEMYLHTKNRSVTFQKSRKMFCFYHFRVFTRCCFQNVIYRFQNLLKKMCRFRVNERPIRHIFHRFQNVPASCERCLTPMRLIHLIKNRVSCLYLIDISVLNSHEFKNF